MKNKKMLCVALTSLALAFSMAGCGSTTTEATGAEVLEGELSADGQNLEGGELSENTEADGNNEMSEERGRGGENAPDRLDGQQYSGQITAIEGNTITIALAQMPEQDMPNGDGRNQGGEPPEAMERPEDGEKPEGMTKPEDGEQPEGMTKPEDGEQPDGMTKPEDGEKPEGMTKPEDGEKPEEMTKPEDGEQPDGMEFPKNGDQPEGGKMQLELTGESKTIEVTETTTITINREAATIADLKVDDMVMLLMDGEEVLSLTVVQ